MTERVACSQCGALILATTATRTGGVCMPCELGTRQSIDARGSTALIVKQRLRGLRPIRDLGPGFLVLGGTQRSQSSFGL